MQKSWSSDQSGSTELKLGTYNGGADVARSFIHFNVSSLIGKHITSATLGLWETWSYSCTARNWEVWNTSLASTATRWTSQPPWYNRWATSGQTKGYSSSCDDGWATADIPNLIQAWADGGYTDVAVGVKAESETDTLGWKRFNSANAGVNIPTLWVYYNSYPGPATNLTITPSSPADGIVYSPTTTPTLTAVGHDADGGGVNMLFRLHPSGNSTPVWEKTETDVPVETARSVTVPPDKLVNGSRYSYIVHTYNALSSTWDWNTANSGWYDVIIDTTRPPTPASIASAIYPNDGAWHGAAGQAGTFTINAAPGEVNPAGYLWGLDTTAPSTRVADPSSSVNLSVTPPTNGPHVLSVRAIDKAGNVSPDVRRYAFNVGRGGLTSPSAGERVVRRVRLVATADPALPYAQFQWRRGQDAATSAALPLTVLTRADGSPLTSAWTALTSLGDYATWDAGTTLGAAGGPAQVRVVLATDASGANAYESPWVDIVVDPNADGAASTGIGPGSVNLLTGDYSLSVTDADEFGLTVGRASSSRDPKAGYQLQAELLTPEQAGMTGALTGFAFPSTDGARRNSPGALIESPHPGRWSL